MLYRPSVCHVILKRQCYAYLCVTKFALFKQAEIAETERELKDVSFKEEVLKKEKQLLEQFASHVSKIHSVKVCHYSL